MSLALEHDRAAQFLSAADATLDFEAAQARLDGAALHLTFDQAGGRAWGQAALFTIVRCAVRMFRGGVFLGPGRDFDVGLRLEPRGGLRRRLLELGARETAAPAGTLRLHLGQDPPPDARLVCFTDGWRGGVAPAVPCETLQPGNEISGALAGALAVAEAFRILVLGDVRAGRRLKSLSAWGHEAPGDARILYLPRSLWMLGLGNLGQAALSVLGLLPYGAGDELELVLQDLDNTGPENLGVQVLTAASWIGRRKARCCAAWAEERAIVTRLVETPFSAVSRRGPGDPPILLAGVDNLDARRWAAGAGFDLVIDAGLGAASADAFDLRLHAFPGARTAVQAWPETSEPPHAPRLTLALEQAVRQGRIDVCGAMTIAGKSVGVPCTALVAAAIQLGQLCRALAEGRCCDLVDASLVGADTGVFKPMACELGPLPFVTRAD